MREEITHTKKEKKFLTFKISPQAKIPKSIKESKSNKPSSYEFSPNEINFIEQSDKSLFRMTSEMNKEASIINKHGFMKKQHNSQQTLKKENKDLKKQKYSKLNQKNLMS